MTGFSHSRIRDDTCIFATFTREVKMPGPKNKESTVGKRLRAYLDYQHGGRQAQLAKLAGVSTSMVSRILQGKQDPPFSVLAVVATDPSLSVRWLLTGDGTMLGTDSAERYLPRTTQLLPGPLASHLNFIEGVAPVTGTLYRPTRYLYQVSKEAVVGDDRLRAGDCLIFETDIGSRDRFDPDQLCVVLNSATQNPNVVTVLEASGKRAPRRPGERATRRITWSNKSKRSSVTISVVAESVIAVCVALHRTW